jgi:hypothetical protein
MGRVVIEKRFLPHSGFVHVQQLLFAHGVRLLSIATASAAKQQAAPFKSRYRKCREDLGATLHDGLGTSDER